VSGIWIVFPPWIYAIAVSMAGRWGQARLFQSFGSASDGHEWYRPGDWGAIVVTNLVFLSLIPISLLAVIGALLPFSGARAGLSLGILAFLFGCTPVRILEARQFGWDRTLWLILIDLLRVGGAMAIVGFLVA